MIKSRTWAVISALNEAAHIADVVRRTKKILNHVVVVDDGSWDGTSQAAFEAGATVLRHLVNMGKGAALKTGFDYALSHGAEYLLALDGDGQHRPEEIPLLLSRLPGCDLVFGARMMSKDMPALLKFGNRSINSITKLLFGIKLKDTQSGYRAMTADAYRKCRWEANDYSMESEMIANAGRHHLKYCEVTISTIYSDKYKGTTIIDGIKITLNLIQWRLRQ